MLASLIFVVFLTSCIVDNSSIQSPAFIYKSDDYALYKKEKGTSFEQLARIQLGDAKWAWKIEDANDVTKFGDGSLILVPLKDHNIGGLFEDGYQSVPILSYHQFGAGKKSTCISPDMFNQQMKYLKDNGYRVITPADLLDFLQYRRQIPKKSVIITIDDGYKSIQDIAWPILKKYNFPATLFIYTNYVGISKKALSWKDLRYLKSQGFTIGSHTVSHADLTKKKPDEKPKDFYRRVRKELALSKKIIDKELKQDTICLAFPYGRQNREVLEIVKSIGYKMAVTVKMGSNPFFTNPLVLKRNMILKKDIRSFISRLKTFNNLSLK
jgi:peptidoglycan/xylan/chitin deacetylase (PgdA/CDA1 family)